MMEFDGTEYNREHFKKPAMTVGRLAEITNNIYHENIHRDFPCLKDSFLFYAAELLKKCRIEEMGE